MKPMSSIAQNRPRFSTEQARDLAFSLYGISAQPSELPSERDQNFFLVNERGEAFVLKIASAADSRDILDLQNKALRRLAEQDPSLTCPRVRLSQAGEELVQANLPGGGTNWVRLLTYVRGRFLADVNPHTPDLLRSLGRFFGRMDRALSGFSHPAAHRRLKWNISEAGGVIRGHLHHIADLQQRALVEMFLRRFESGALRVLPRLRCSVIHNDGNDFNVLVSTAQGETALPWDREVSGVIDFGDMLYCCTVCELATAAAYAILGKKNPIEAAAHVIGGYNDVFPLVDAEIGVIYDLMCIRLCTSVVLSAFQQSEEPDNRYLSISEKPAWHTLQRLSTLSPSFAYYVFRHACGMEPCPSGAALAGWLKKNRARFGRVIEPDLRGPDALVLDLGAGSPLLGNIAELSDTRKFTELLFGHMRARNARVGIGRYNEARLLYTGDAFRAVSNDAPRWRTVHTGIDFYIPPGSPVYAPLEGTVHSFANNRNRYDYGPTIILQHDLREHGGNFWTLFGHLSEDSLERLCVGMPVLKGAQIASIGNFPANGDWPPHLHFQIIADMLGMEGDFPGVAAPAERAVWLSISPDPALILDLPEATTAVPQPDCREILALRRKRIGKSLSVSYKEPLHILRGFMEYLYDAEGRPYLDTVNNVAHVGHCHPRVLRALHEQSGALNTNTRYLHENLVRYALRLCATLPESLRVCYFVNSGSEANDLALRLARTHTGRKGVIAVEGAYHGNLTSLIEISPYKFDGPGGSGAPPYTLKVSMPDDYRGRYKRDDPFAGQKYARDVKEAIVRARVDSLDVAAFICESILSCGGQIVLPQGYLREAYHHARSAGAICIADEVQVGFGRPGTHFWAFEMQGVVPDIVTMGKPIGNGHPLAAVVTTREIADSFDNGMEYFNTYGGNPVSCAVGLAVLDVLRDEKLQENALAVGAYLKERLAQLMQRHQIIGDVRGTGLFLGVELVRDRHTLEPAAAEASYTIERMREQCILASIDGPLHNVIKIKPPLVFNKYDADAFLSALGRILSEDFIVQAGERTHTL